MGFVGAPLPEFYRPAFCNSVQANNTNRKRLRDSVNHLYAVQNFPATAHQLLPSSFDATPDILQYQLEMDDIISQHNNKIRLELEERRKQQARLLMAAAGEGVMKKLREKDEQIQTMGKLNLVLQERVKSLYVENQLWRDLAQTNEAAANSLRTNLEQVLLQVSGGGEEDVESCCGSRGDIGRDEDGGGRERMCSICGEREPSVLLLPCRHLCLCGTCGSGSRRLQACPVCKTSMDATLHVNMTSS